MTGPNVTRLAGLVTTYGWEDGVCAFLNACNPAEKKTFLQDLHFGKQAAWMLWVGRTSQANVLNFDSGIGTTTVALSYLFSQVAGIFPDVASSACAMIRANDEGQSNVKALVRRNTKELISQNAKFDLICLSDFQLWLGYQEMSPQNPLDFLAGLFRLLSSGGMVYLGVRNIPYLGRFRPGHQEFREKWLTSFLQRTPYRGLKRLQFYPVSGSIEMVSEVKSQKSLALWVRSNLQKVLRGESYGLILGEPSSKVPLGVIGDIGNQENDESVGTDITVHVGTASTLIGKMPGRIVRFPLGARALSRAKRNFQTLTQIHEKTMVLTPTPCKTGRFGDVHYFVESKLPGYEPRAKKKWPWPSDTLTGQAFTYLVQLHGSTAQKVILDDMLFEKLVGVPLENLAGYCKGADKDFFANAEVLLKERLLGKEMVLVRTHGDYKRTNLLVNKKGKIVGVIDWDLSREPGFPFLDLLWYLSYEMCLEQSIAFHQAIVRMSFEENLAMNDWVQLYWHEFCPDHGDRQKLYAAILLLYQFYEHQDHWHKVDEEWISRVMMPALRLVFKNALGDAVELNRPAS